MKKILLLIIVAYLVLLLSKQGEYGLTWDEAANINTGVFFHEGIKSLVGTGSPSFAVAHLKRLSAQYNSFSVLYYPPLFYVLEAVSFILFGVSAFSARLVAMAFSVGAIFLVYRIGELVYGGRAGLVAALLLAASPMFFKHSMMALLDVPVAFFYLLLAYLVLQPRMNVWRLGLAFGLGLLTKYDVVLFVPIAFAYFLVVAKRSDWKKLAAGFLIGIVIASLWAIPTLLAKPSSSDQPSRLMQWVSNLGRQWSPSQKPFDFAVYGKWLFYGMSPIIWLLGLVGSGWTISRAIKKRKELHKGGWLIAIWLMVVYAFLSVAMVRLPRYSIEFLPALAILGAGLVTLLLKDEKKLAVGLTAIIAVSAVWYGPGLAKMDEMNLNYPYKLPMEEVARYLADNSEKGDLVLMVSFTNEASPYALAFHLMNADAERKLRFVSLQAYPNAGVEKFEELLKRDCPKFAVMVDMLRENESSRLLKKDTEEYSNFIKGRFRLEQVFPYETANISVYERPDDYCGLTR